MSDTKIHHSFLSVFLIKMQVGDIVIERRPQRANTTQKVGVLLETKKIIKNGATLKVGNVSWFGQVKDLNTEQEAVFADDEATTGWVNTSSLQILKRAINE
jgi:hypothetical protein